MGHYLFTSESVCRGHPDKIADQISDAMLDACLIEDPMARVACETLVTRGLVVLSGEITTTAQIDPQEIARQAIADAGYKDCELGFDYRSCGVITSINKQSPDIARGVDENEALEHELGAGDQGLMFGYASDETSELMPLPIMMAHRIVKRVRQLREEGILPYLRPDGKAQVTVEYDENHRPLRIHTVVISVQHHPDVTHGQIREDMKAVAEALAPEGMIDSDTLFYINPTGRFVLGGPAADCGLTGRKIIVDTYGGMGRHGGGAFSGKDPTKVDRSATYAARYIAKHLVAADLARRCEVQLSYAIGFPRPVSIRVEAFGTASVSEHLLSQAIPLVFDLSPKGIIKMLDLRRPIYRRTAYEGHFGRHEKEFIWERTDRIQQLLEAVKQVHHAVP